MKKENRKQKAEGSSMRKEAQKNKDTERCKRCVTAGVYNINEPHASPRSSRCPYHPINMKDLLKNVFDNHTRFIRRIPLSTVLNLDPTIRNSFIQNTEKLVDYGREVAVKSQLFATYFILKMIEDVNNPNAEPKFTTILINECFYRSCMQLVIGEKITNKRTDLPSQRMEEEFKIYKDNFIDEELCQVDTGSMATFGCILSSMSKQSAITVTNNIVETFNGRIEQFIDFRCRMYLKVSTYIY